MSQTPVPITGGSGSSSVAAELVAGISYQEVEIYGPGGSSVLAINPDGSIKASIIGTPAFTFSGSPSVSGAVTIVGASIPNGSVSGTVGSSVIGTVPVTQVTNPWIITGSVQASITPSANQSVSGTVGASIIGQLPAGTAPLGSVATLQGTNPWVVVGSVYGNIAGSVATFQGGAWTTSVVGGPVTLYAPTTSFVSGAPSVITGTSSVVLLPTAAGGQRNYITQVLVTNAAAVGTTVSLIDAGQVVYSGFAAASGGGFSVSFPFPLRQTSITGSLGVVAGTQASVYVSASGYTAP